jgi:hypothetical protein
MIRRRQRNPGIFVAVAISSFLALVLFRDLLVPGHIHADFSLGGDTFRHLVIWASAKNSIANGFWPFWVPELANGFPLWASFQWGLASPAFLLFVLLPVELAHTASAVLHLVLAGSGIYCLSQRLSVGRSGGLIALVSYSFSSFFVGRIAVGHIFLVWPMAWVPWSLWALDRAIVRPTGARVAVAAIFLCAALTAGHVHMAIYVYLLIVVWTIGRLWWEWGAGNANRIGLLRRTATSSCGVLLLGTGLAAIQWLPFLELLSASQGVPMTELDLRAASMPLEGLWNFLLPHVRGLRSESNFFGAKLYHETLCASSAAVVWLALLGTFPYSRKWGGVLAGLVIIGLILGLGTQTPLYELIRSVIPFLQNSRTPGRVLACVLLAISLLAARGHRSLEWRIKRGQSVLPAVSVGAVLLCLVLAGALHVRSLAASRLPVALVDPVVVRSALGASIPLALLLGSLLWSASGKRVDWWRWSVVTVLALSALVEEGRRLQAIPTDALYATPPDAVAKQKPHRFRIFDGTRFTNAPIFGLQATGFHSVTMLESQPYRAFWGGLTKPRARIANVRYFHFQDRKVAAAPAHGGGKWQQTQAEPLPRAKLYWRTEVIPETAKALEAIDRGAISIRDTLLLHERVGDGGFSDQEGGGRDRGEEAASDVEFVTYQPGRIELRVTNPLDGWLYLAEKFAPGWQARLDGEPVRMRRAFVAFEALRVPAGTHEITLVYQPLSIRIGALVSAASGVAILALLLISRRRRGTTAVREAPSDLAYAPHDGARTWD